MIKKYAYKTFIAYGLKKVESLLCINKAKPLSWSYLYNTHKQKEDSNSFFFFFFG